MSKRNNRDQSNNASVWSVCYEGSVTLLLEGNLINPPVLWLPKQLEPYIVSQVLLHWLVDKKFSYPPVPSPASITPPQPFSPGQIHMHRGGQKDGWMDMEREGRREREKETDGGRWWQHTKPVEVICMRQISNSIQFKSFTIQLNQGSFS